LKWQCKDLNLEWLGPKGECPTSMMVLNLDP
jgi:hypothetical protein